MSIHGGSVLGSGSYGCVFLPALKCQNEKERAPHKISKLMTTKYAKEEYYQIVSIRKKLSTIPHYEKYFLLKGITLCQPAPLSISDIKGFDTRCNALPQDRIYSSNINTQLDNMMVITMPDGGVTLDEYVTTGGFVQNVHEINHRLIALLEKGIVPMNRRGVYHGDIKDTNVLVSMDGQVRLIDWGLAMEYNKHKGHPIPKQYMQCALQFNAPFSIILFSLDFQEKYEQFQADKSDSSSLDSFLFNYLTWFVKKEQGHYKVINEIMYMLVASELNIQDKNKSMVIETQYTLRIIIRYLSGILKKYTRRGKFQANEYFNAVFVSNLDIWGFVCCYFPILQYLSENQERTKTPLFHRVKELFLQILFQEGEKVISIPSLARHLQKLTSDKAASAAATANKHKHKNRRSTRRRRTQRRKRSLTNFQNPFLLSL